VGISYRIAQFRAERRLRPLSVGRWAESHDRPIIEAVEAVAGYTFRLHSIEATTVIRGAGRLRIGNDVYLNSGVRIECHHEVTFGDHILVAFGAVIMDSDLHGYEGRPPRRLPVTIGSGSWIGANSVILPGVSVGRRAIVAAGSVVTHDVDDDTLVAGNPARVVRRLTFPDWQMTAYN